MLIGLEAFQHQPPAARGAVDGDATAGRSASSSASAFWNLVGAGVFGFLINPPIALYYMQGLNTTPVHAHTALFGVYGLLSLGADAARRAARCRATRAWKRAPLAVAFWSMNIGLGADGRASACCRSASRRRSASVDDGLWYARSAEFLQQPWLQDAALDAHRRRQPVPRSASAPSRGSWPASGAAGATSRPRKPSAPAC